ncbi:MAG TPA: WD40 repeat domain-containing protein [Hyphomicrobium sp.]
MLVSLKGYEEAVRNAGFSPDGERILTATFDGVARIWDVSSYQPR